ncbi:hypothetical protein ACFLVW_05970 [Chloroflexota bacterium]
MRISETINLNIPSDGLYVDRIEAAFGWGNQEVWQADICEGTTQGRGVGAGGGEGHGGLLE